MKSCLALLIFLGIMPILSAQKTVQKTILDTKDTAVEINANSCFLVTINTADTNEISVRAQMDGEYSKDLLLNVHEEGKTLVVNTSFNPLFEPPNDKLSAHKVLSISLNITIPEYMKVSIYGTYSTVKATGKYQHINISLNDGKCILREVSDVAYVNTQSGTIDLFSKSGTLTAVSKYGKVSAEKLEDGHNQYQLNSITGNINVYKTNEP